MTAKVDFSVKYGATFRKLLSYTTEPDFSDYHAKMQIRKHRSDAEPLVEITHEDGITMGANGTIELVIGWDVLTEALPEGFRGVYDLRIVSEHGAGEAKFPIEGEFEIEPSVTK